ncbi:MAG: nucleotidyltransferase family protein [Candidatus Pacebacteria bacterium]|nr:nucleotidyltransferase family protein [Candidatus Paceibacterota bacterium]
MIKKEYDAVLEIIKFGNKKREKDKLLAVLENKDLNWIEILGYLCYHRVAGLAYENINAINLRKLDFPVFFTIYMIHQSQSIRTELQKKYIKSIFSVLRKANIEHVFLKGSILSHIIYPTGTRAFNDIDILVSKKSIQSVKKALHELGFLQGKYNYKNGVIDEFNQDTIAQSINTRGEMAPFVKIVNEKNIKTIDIDVNFSLNWKPDSPDEAVDYFLDERVLIPVDNNFSIYSLKKEHLFIHLCSHFYKDSALIDLIKKRKVLDLYKFVDIYVFIQAYFKEINPEKIFNDSVRYGFDRHVFFALNYVIKVFPDILTIKNVDILYQKYNYINNDVMTVIFDQYNSEIKMKDKSGLIDRLFSYDIIKNYK